MTQGANGRGGYRQEALAAAALDGQRGKGWCEPLRLAARGCATWLGGRPGGKCRLEGAELGLREAEAPSEGL
ncbi:hypothetical protein D3C84_1021130 [compost metagenome]